MRTTILGVAAALLGSLGIAQAQITVSPNKAVMVPLTQNVPFNGRTVVNISVAPDGQTATMSGSATARDTYGPGLPSTTYDINTWCNIGDRAWNFDPHTAEPAPVNGLADFDHLSALLTLQATRATSLFEALDGTFDLQPEYQGTLGDTGLKVTAIHMESWAETSLGVPNNFIARRGPETTTTVVPPRPTFHQNGQNFTPEQMQAALVTAGFSQQAAQAVTQPVVTQPPAAPPPPYPFTQAEWDVLHEFQVTVKYEITVEVEAGLTVPAQATVKVGGTVGVEISGSLTTWLQTPSIGVKVGMRLANDAKTLCEQGLDAAKQFVQKAIDQATAWLQAKLNDPNTPAWLKALGRYLLNNMGHVFNNSMVLPHHELDGLIGNPVDSVWLALSNDQVRCEPLYLT